MALCPPSPPGPAFPETAMPRMVTPLAQTAQSQGGSHFAPSTALSLCSTLVRLVEEGVREHRTYTLW